MAMRVIATEGEIQVSNGDAFVPLLAGDNLNLEDNITMADDAILVVENENNNLLFIHGNDLVFSNENSQDIIESEAIRVSDLPFSSTPKTELVSIFDVNANLVYGDDSANWPNDANYRYSDEDDNESDVLDEGNNIDFIDFNQPFMLPSGENYSNPISYTALSSSLIENGNIIFPIKLSIQFSTSENEQISDLVLKGFPPGSKIVIGSFHPSLGEVTEFSEDHNSINITPGDIAAGVYFIPVDNSETDVSFSYALTLVDLDSGLTDTLSGSALVIIDSPIHPTQIDIGNSVSEQPDTEITDSMFYQVNGESFDESSINYYQTENTMHDHIFDNKVLFEEDTLFIFDDDLNNEAIYTIPLGGFNPAENKLDLSDILSVDSKEDDINNYIKFEDDGMNTTVSIDKSGSGDFTASNSENQATFIIQGVVLDNVEQLFTNGKIIVDE